MNDDEAAKKYGIYRKDKYNVTININPAKQLEDAFNLEHPELAGNKDDVAIMSFDEIKEL